MQREHEYEVRMRWTGNSGAGTAGYRTYSRDHEISAPGKLAIPGSADPAFRGDPSRYNPEELLIGSLSACHMLWYLHLCVQSQITVVEYLDDPRGIMVEAPDGGGRFKEVLLRPRVAIKAGGDTTLAGELHERAHERCFIANSINFPVRCEPAIRVAEAKRSVPADSRRRYDKHGESEDE